MKNSLRNTLLACFLIVLGGTLAGAGFGWSHSPRAGEILSRYIIQVPLRSATDARGILGWLRSQGFDVAGFNWRQGKIEVITNDSGIAKLNSNGLRGYTLAQEQIGSIRSIDPRYLDPAKVELALKNINQKFPSVTKLEQIGTSTEGRPIWALLISSTPNLRDPQAWNKPTILIDGMHHARELMTSEVVLDIATTLLSAGQRRVPEALKYIESWNIWLVPMLNVDGNNMVWTQDSWWRKNTRGDSSSGVYGVDINRNYPYAWNSCRGSSGSMGAQDYRGPSLASEPETQALIKLADFVSPTAYLSYHSYGELVLYPLGCEGNFSAEKMMVEKIGHELAAKIPTIDGRRSGYSPGTAWQILYAVDGDSMSYMHAQHGALSYTLEIGQEFQPSFDTKTQMLESQRIGWQFLFERMTQNMLSLKVIDGRTGQAAVGKVEINTIQHSHGERELQTNAAGTFFKVLDPGTYQIRITLRDGRQQQVAVTMNGEPQQTQVVVP